MELRNKTQQKNWVNRIYRIYREIRVKLGETKTNVKQG